MSSPYALGTFSVAGSPAFTGLVLGDQVVALHSLRELARSLGQRLSGTDDMVSLLEEWEQNQAALTALAAHLSANPGAAPFVAAGSLKTHAPVERPRQYFCSGANYFKHVVDLIVDQDNDPAVKGQPPEVRRDYAVKLMTERSTNGTPYIFSKAYTAITGPFDDIEVPENVEQPDWELELAVVIGKPAFHVSESDALDYIAGYTIVNDISNRELIHRHDLKAIGTDWVMGKSLPGYSPMGPYLVPAAQISDPQDLLITLRHNGDVMQNESTADMIFPIKRLIAYLTQRIQLLPGDVLLTGSPSGNGSHYNRFLKPGDVVEGEIAGLGVQRNCFVAPRAR